MLAITFIRTISKCLGTEKERYRYPLIGCTNIIGLIIHLSSYFFFQLRQDQLSDERVLSECDRIRRTASKCIRTAKAHHGDTKSKIKEEQM